MKLGARQQMGPVVRSLLEEEEVLVLVLEVVLSRELQLRPSILCLKSSRFAFSCFFSTAPRHKARGSLKK